MFTLEAGDLIEGDASVASKIDYVISGVEEATGEVTIQALADGQLPSIKGTLYTVPVSTTTIIKSITLVNTDTSDRTVNLYIKPGATSRKILATALTLDANGGFAYVTDHIEVYTKDGALKTSGATTGHNILDGSIHGDTVADAVTRGSIIIGNATPKWDELVVGTGLLRGDGTDVAWRSYANVLADLSGQAGAAFDLNGQDLTGLGDLIPTSDNAKDLGSSTVGWEELHIAPDYLLTDGGSTFLYLRNSANSAYKGLYLSVIGLFDNLYFRADNKYISAPNEDNMFTAFMVRDNGSGRVEAARLQGAADPYMQFTLPFVLTPGSAPGVAVEGHFFYRAADDLLCYINGAAATKVLMVVGDPATAHAILDGSVHNDSVADGVTRGSIIYGNSTPKWDELVKGAANTFLGSDGTDVSYRTKTQVLTSLNVADGADVTGSNAPQGHSASHEDTGGDEIDVAALSGLLADDQHVLDSEVLSAAKTIKRSYSITVEDPTSSEDITIAFTEKAITITEIRAVLIGSATPSVTWKIRHHTDRNNAGNAVVTAGTVTTSTTAGSDVTAFDDATIPADSFIWLETTAKSGTVTEIHVTIVYTVD